MRSSFSAGVSADSSPTAFRRLLSASKRMSGFSAAPTASAADLICPSARTHAVPATFAPSTAAWPVRWKNDVSPETWSFASRSQASTFEPTRSFTNVATAVLTRPQCSASQRTAETSRSTNRASLLPISQAVFSTVFQFFWSHWFHSRSFFVT